MVLVILHAGPLSRFRECYYDYSSSSLIQSPFHPQHAFMSVVQYLSDFWHFFLFFPFLWRSHDSCPFPGWGIIWNQTFLWQTPLDVWIMCVLRIGGNQGPTRTIIMDIPPNLWKKCTRDHHTRLYIWGGKKQRKHTNKQKNPDFRFTNNRNCL